MIVSIQQGILFEKDVESFFNGSANSRTRRGRTKGEGVNLS
jgi:hypothetical protein